MLGILILIWFFFNNVKLFGGIIYVLVNNMVLLKILLLCIKNEINFLNFFFNWCVLVVFFIVRFLWW